MNNDLFVDSKFSSLSNDGDTKGGAGVQIFLLSLKAKIHCQPEALKEFLKKGPAMKAKGDKAVKSGEGEVYDMTYRVSTRTARYEVRQEHSWEDGKAIGSEAEFLLVASPKEDQEVAAAPGSSGAGVESIQGKPRKRDAVKEAAKGVIKRAVMKEKGAKDAAEGVFRVERVALTSVTELFPAPHGTTEIRVTCQIEGAAIKEMGAKKGRRRKRRTASVPPSVIPLSLPPFPLYTYQCSKSSISTKLRMPTSSSTVPRR